MVRGVNISPSSIENVIRTFDEIGEFQVTAIRDGEMDQLQFVIESAHAELPNAIAEALNRQLGLRIDVEAVTGAVFRAAKLNRSDLLTIESK